MVKRGLHYYYFFWNVLRLYGLFVALKKICPIDISWKRKSIFYLFIFLIHFRITFLN